MKSILFLLFSGFILLATDSYAQPKDAFTVRLNKNIFKPGDTLAIDASYTTSDKTVLPPSTLQVIIENDRGNRTQLRWPVIDGAILGKIFLPDSLPRGKYTIALALQPVFFEVVGKIASPERNGLLNAMLLTSKGEWDTQEVPVAPDGSFTVGKWLFENDAIMAFSGTRKNDPVPDVRINTRLDSTFEPLATATREIYFGTTSVAVRLDSLGKRTQTDVSSYFNRGELLPAVVVTAKSKSPAEQFNDQYSSGLFKSSDARIISLLDDPSAVAFPSVLTYLQGRVAGLQISNAGFTGGRAIWRGNPVSFFVDEIRVDAQQVSSISMADIAIVKAYPPPFFGAPGGGSGGAIAIYTRRGGETQFLPANRSVFKIRGYTPLVTVLKLK